MRFDEGLSKQPPSIPVVIKSGSPGSETDGGGLYEAETEEEVDASLQEALLNSSQRAWYENVGVGSGYEDNRHHSDLEVRRGADPDDEDDDWEAEEIRWTASRHVGLNRDLWIETRYDAERGTWRARWDRLRPSSPAATVPDDFDEAGTNDDDDDDDEATGPVLFDDNSQRTADALVRENARLRNIIRLSRGGGNHRGEVSVPDAFCQLVQENSLIVYVERGLCRGCVPVQLQVGRRTKS